MANLEALAGYQEIFQRIGNYGGIAGVNMNRPNYRPTWVTWMWILINASFILSAIFTIITYDTQTKWMCANTLGISLQGMTKYIVLMTHHKRINEKIRFLGNVYQSNTHATSKNLKTLTLWSERGRLFAKYIFLIEAVLKQLMLNLPSHRYGSVPIVFTSLLFVFWAVGVMLWTGETELILHFMLPFVSPDDPLGFALLSGYHVSGLVLASCGTCGADFLLVVLVFHLWPLSDILDNMCTELNERLLMESNRCTTELRDFYWNILKIHQDICLFLEDISDVYYYMVFVEIYTCALTLCTLLYCMFTFTYFPNFFMAGFFLGTMFIYCILGTVAELAMDRVYNTLINSKWYMLPLPQQLCTQLVFAKAQNPTILMAGTLPLNVDTFVQVMKTVYSVGMLLLESTS